MPPKLMVRAQDAHKTYNSGAVKVHALRGVSLEVAQGEMVAIMGPSGCGKTTLLNCFSGLDDLSSGSVQIEGVPLESLDDGERTEYRAKRMGFIFQSYNLIPVLTAVENVELPLLVSGHDARESRRRALEMLERVGLADRVRHKPAELSAGQQQRVAVARALVNTPAIVWADEPTGNLDSENSDAIMGLIDELNEKNRQTFVLVTHDAAIGARADRVLRMVNGQIVETTRNR